MFCRYRKLKAFLFIDSPAGLEPGITVRRLVQEVLVAPVEDGPLEAMEEAVALVAVCNNLVLQ